MKPERQRRRQDEKGRKKKSENIFSLIKQFKAKKKGEKHKLFSLTKRNREKVRRQKLMMMAHT